MMPCPLALFLDHSWWINYEPVFSGTAAMQLLCQ